MSTTCPARLSASRSLAMVGQVLKSACSEAGRAWMLSMTAVNDVRLLQVSGEGRFLWETLWTAMGFVGVYSGRKEES